MTVADGPATGTEGRPKAGAEGSVGDDLGTERNVVFVVGCPRSGTTWVQLLLAEHPEVITASKTQIFAYFLDHFQQQRQQERAGSAAAEQGGAGLSRLLADDEVDELCRGIDLAVLRRIAGQDPEACTVVEKSPRHALHVQWIHRLFPDARFLHMIRDPRDTISSLVAAGGSWGTGWAPRSHPRSVPLVGLCSDRELVEEAAEACRLARLRNRADGEQMPVAGESSPDDSFRKGEARGWSKDLSSGQVRVVEHICGELMQELQYEKSQTVRIRPALRVALHDGLQRIREAVDWQLEWVVRRV